MRVPPAQVHLHHSYSRFHQPPRDEKRLAPFLTTIKIANLIGFARQIKRIVPTRVSRGEQSHRLMPVRVPRIEQARRISRIESLAHGIQPGEKRDPVLNLRDCDSTSGQIGKMEISRSATRIVPPGIRSFTRSAVRV